MTIVRQVFPGKRNAGAENHISIKNMLINTSTARGRVTRYESQLCHDSEKFTGLQCNLKNMIHLLKHK